jgi:hypothetical protein
LVASTVALGGQPPTHKGEPDNSPAKAPPPPDVSIPGLEDTDFRVKPAPLRGEGTFLLRQRGSIVKLPGGEKAFIFHPDETGKSERPMVLVQSTTLQRMEQAAADRPGQTAFAVSGQVFAYRGVNYLLPSAYAIVHENEQSSGAAPGAPRANEPMSTRSESDMTPSGDKPAAASSDPSVQELIKQLEAQRERPRTIEPGVPLAPPNASGTPSRAPGSEPPPAATAPIDPEARIIPEGKTVIRRRARMVRASSGEWSIAFDSGPQGSPNVDRPMVLVPCMNLQRMEAWAASRGDAVSLEVSGMVLAYQGRNYLLPTLFRVDTIHELEPRQ